MQGNQKLNRVQRSLHRKALSIIKYHSHTKRSFFSHPFAACKYAIQKHFFSKKYTIHEDCVLITEETRNLFILKETSLTNFTAVIKTINSTFRQQCQEDGILFLSLLSKQLLRNVLKDLLANNQSELSSSDIETVLTSDTILKSSFHLGDIRHYVIFLKEFIPDDKKTRFIFLKEARNVLDKRCLLTTYNLVLRGLAHATISIITQTEGTQFNRELLNEFYIEFASSISFNAVGSTAFTREITLDKIDESFQTFHPYLNKIRTVVNYFNSNLSIICTFMYIAAIGSIFITRIYAKMASDKFQDNIKSVLNNTNNITIFFNNTPSYASAASNNSYYSKHNNSSNNLTIYIPEDPSEYFPEFSGLLNGIPSYATTLMSTIQLFFTLPALFIAVYRKNFSLEYHKKYNPTQEERRANCSFLCVTVFRWLGNVIMQPIDIVTSTEKDQFFKWTVLRFFTPTACIEEPLKAQMLSNSIQQYSYRNRGTSFSVNLKLMFLASLLVTALEFVGQACSLGVEFNIPLKFVRVLSVVTPIIQNKYYGRLIYSPQFAKFILANMARTLTSPGILPAYDAYSNKLRYASLLSAMDVLATVQADAIAGNIICEANQIEEALLAIDENIVEPAIQNNTNANFILLAPNIEKQLSKLKNQITIINIVKVENTKKQITPQNIKEEVLALKQSITRNNANKTTEIKSTDKSQEEELSLCPKVELDFSRYRNRKYLKKRTKGSLEATEKEHPKLQGLNISIDPQEEKSHTDQFSTTENIEPYLSIAPRYIGGIQPSTSFIEEITEEATITTTAQQRTRRSRSPTVSQDLSQVVIEQPRSTTDYPFIQQRKNITITKY